MSEDSSGAIDLESVSSGTEVFGLWGSLRQGSLNGKLVREVAGLAKELGDVEVRTEGLGAFDMPLYNADRQREEGFPEGADRLKERLDGADALIFGLPEYNHSIPGAFKNAVDWLSRYRPRTPFAEKPILLVSAAKSIVGGQRGLQQSHVPLQALGAHVYPSVFGLSMAQNAFDEQGHLVNEDIRHDLKRLVEGFLSFGARL